MKKGGNKHEKRLISLLLAIVMVLGLIPAMAMNANAAPATVIIVDGRIYMDGESSDSGHVQFQNGVLTITGKGSPVIFDDNSAMPATIKNIDDGDLTIKFEDDVEIIAPAGGKGILVAGNLTMIIAEGKTVTISADYECIEAQGIEIMGNGTLILKSESSECIDSVADYRAGYLTIQNAVVKAETNAADCGAIMAQDMTFANSDVSAVLYYDTVIHYGSFKMTGGRLEAVSRSNGWALSKGYPSCSRTFSSELRASYMRSNARKFLRTIPVSL